MFHSLQEVVINFKDGDFLKLWTETRPVATRNAVEPMVFPVKISASRSLEDHPACMDLGTDISKVII